MKIFRLILVLGLIVSFSGISYSRDVDTEDDSKSNSGGNALSSALMGGLLGAGLGAAIGSASGKAGQGAAIGAGVGAVGGTLLGAEKARKEKAEAAYYDEEAPESPRPEPSKNMKVKKRIIREYDDQGNVVSEKEVPG